MRFPTTVLVLIVAAVRAHGDGTNDISHLRRLYDFTPVSATNPVIARVESCSIEIPVSEFRTYVRSSVTADAGAATKPLSGADKKRLLDDLLNEHFLLWDGYQKKADQTPEMIQLLKSTEAMLLQETFVQQEVGDKAKTAAEYEQFSKKLNEDLFEKAEITVSVEACNDLKVAVQRLNRGATPAKAGSVPSDAGELPPGVRDYPLARCRAGTITVADVFHLYAGMPAEKRPDLERQDALTGLLKTLFEEALLADAARAHGLEKSPIVLEKIRENRNTLTRMYAIDRLTDKAVARMKEAGTATRIREWYEANQKTRYTYTNDQRQPQVISFESSRESIGNDYFDFLNEQMRVEYVRGLRQGRPVQIDDRLLEQLVVFPSVTAPAELSSSVVVWDSDTQTYTVANGETNALFHFQFTNASSEAVTLFEIKPSCECTTVRMPPLPWKLAPGEKGEFDARVDLRNKTNSYTRTLQVESSQGSKTLTLNIVVPPPAARSTPVIPAGKPAVELHVPSREAGADATER